MFSDPIGSAGAKWAAPMLVVGAIGVLASAVSMLSQGVATNRLAVALVSIVVLAIAVRYSDTRRVLGALAFLTYTLLFAPIIIVLVYAFNAGDIITVWSGFSTKWFVAAVNDTQVTTAIAESLRIALGSSLLSVLLATAGALVIAKARFSLRMSYEAVLFLTLVVPELVLAIGLLLFYIRFGVPFGRQTVMIGHSVFGTSVALLIVRARYTGTGLDLERASEDLGAGPWATLRQVTIPRLSPAILAAFLLTFVLSFDDVVVSQFTAGGTPTWPLYLLSALRFGISPEVNAASALLLAVILILACATALVMRRLARPAGVSTSAQTEYSSSEHKE